MNIDEQLAVALAVAVTLCCCLVIAVWRSWRFTFREGLLPPDTLPTTAVGKLRHGIFDKRFQNVWTDRLVDKRAPPRGTTIEFSSIAAAPATTAFRPPVAVRCSVREQIQKLYVERNQLHMIQRIDALLLEWRGNERGLLAQVEADANGSADEHIAFTRPVRPTDARVSTADGSVPLSASPMHRALGVSVAVQTTIEPSPSPPRVEVRRCNAATVECYLHSL
jgi:hypothetical protein